MVSRKSNGSVKATTTAPKSNMRYNHKWSGQDLGDFISVSVYTGLRVSVVSTFQIDRMRPSGEIHIRTTRLAFTSIHGFPGGCRSAYVLARRNTARSSLVNTKPKTLMSCHHLFGGIN